MVDLLDMLEGPLIGPESQRWKSEPRTMPEEYEHWQDAQLFSNEAVKEYAIIKEMVNPLEMMKKKANVDRLWQQVNYVRIYHSAYKKDSSLMTISELRGQVRAEDSDALGSRGRARKDPHVVRLLQDTQAERFR